MENIWFDYRWLDRDDQMLECIKDYAESLKLYCGKMDREIRVSVFSSLDIENIVTFQYYDLFYAVVTYCNKQCFQYSEFWNVAFEIAENIDVDVYSPFFFRNPKFMEIICQKIDKYRTLRLSACCLFEATNYVGHEIQDSYYKFVCDYVLKRSDRDQVFERLVKAGKIARKYLLDKRYVS